MQQSLQTHCPVAAKADPARLHLGAVAFIHRFGSSLNTHVHFHVCVIDGLFEALADAQSDAESHEAKDINERAAFSQHGGGFSVYAGVRIEAADRAGLERLLRYCARSPFAMDRLKQRGADLVYRCGKGHTELINRIAQLVPPPRTHRNRYYGVLAPKSPLRAAVTASAGGAGGATVDANGCAQPRDRGGECRCYPLNASIIMADYPLTAHL